MTSLFECAAESLLADSFGGFFAPALVATIVGGLIVGVGVALVTYFVIESRLELRARDKTRRAVLNIALA